MLLRRLRCPHEKLAALEAIDDGRLLLPSQLAEGDTGWDWWSMSVKRLEFMLIIWFLLQIGVELERPFSLPKAFVGLRVVLCFDGRSDG